MTRPETLTAYDDNGNVISVTDPRGIETTTEYDELNRQRFTHQALGTPAEVTTETEYDAHGNTIARTLHNVAEDGTTAQPQTTTYAFDAFDRQVSRTLPGIGDGLTRQTTSK